MLDSIYHLTLKYLKLKHQDCPLFFATLYWAKICKPLVIYRFYCLALYYSKTPRRHLKNSFSPAIHLWVSGG